MRTNIGLCLALAVAFLCCDPLAAQPQPAALPTRADLRQALVAIGAPDELAAYISEARLQITRSEERALAFRETFPDASVRTVSYELVGERRYALSEEERAAARVLGTNVYDVRVDQTTDAAGTTTMRVEFFVPYDELSPDLRERVPPSAAFNWLALLGVDAAVAQGAEVSGAQVVFTQTTQEVNEQAFELLTDRLGVPSVGAAASAFNDVAEARQLAAETQRYLNRLDELERCIRNPDHDVPVPEDERQRQLDTIANIRAELKRVSVVRFAIIGADAPLVLLERTGNPAAALIGAGMSLAMKPLGAMSDQALKQYIQGTLMREAEVATGPCRQVCAIRWALAPVRPIATSGGAPVRVGAATSGRARPPSNAGAPQSSGSTPASSASGGASPQGRAAVAIAAQRPPTDPCDTNNVVIQIRDVEQIDDVPRLDRLATFWGTTVVREIYPGVKEGTATGIFREHAESRGNLCEYIVDTRVAAQMRVRIREDIREVQVAITSDAVMPSNQIINRGTDERCEDQPYSIAQPERTLSLSCTFLNVDLENGGQYTDQFYTNFIDNDERRFYDCALRLAGPPEDPPPDPDQDPEESPRGGLPIPSSSGNPPRPPAAASAAAGAAAGAVAPAASQQDASTSGRFRVLLTGARAVAPTVDTPSRADGAGDEVYGVGVSFLFDRAARSASGFRLDRTREYGDTGAAGVSTQRLRAGRASATGGLQAGDAVPQGVAPDLTSSGVRDQFALLVWEGTLSPGREALVIVPSLWERDTQSRLFDAYRVGWLTASPVLLMAQPALAADLTTPGLRVVEIAAPADDEAARSAAGRHVAVPTAALTADGGDRPIGIEIQSNAATYTERYVVVTREKLALLPIGGATTLSVLLRDSDPVRLGGDYELQLRVERIE